MVEQRPTPSRIGAPAAPTRPAPPAAALTPKEVFLIFRRHIFLIIVFTILGLMAGGGAWKLLLRYFLFLLLSDQVDLKILLEEPYLDVYLENKEY